MLLILAQELVSGQWSVNGEFRDEGRRFGQPIREWVAVANRVVVIL
jgi:hypothetical protein